MHLVASHPQPHPCCFKTSRIGNSVPPPSLHPLTSRALVWIEGLQNVGIGKTTAIRLVASGKIEERRYVENIYKQMFWIRGI